MATVKKFTFRKEPHATGLMGVAYPYPNTVIKWQKKNVGDIYGPNYTTPDNKWRIRLAVKNDKNWQWWFLKKTFNTEPQARVWINAHINALTQCNLHQFEDE